MQKECLDVFGESVFLTFTVMQRKKTELREGGREVLHKFTAFRRYCQMQKVRVSKGAGENMYRFYRHA